MFAPPPLPRTLDAAFRDVSSKTADTRAGAARDVVRHALSATRTASPEEASALRTRAIDVLATLLDDASPIVRSAAALGLGELEASNALPKLLLRVEDEDVNVRQMALTALGELGDTRALPRLQRALGDARPEVRYQAVIAVGRLASPADAAESLAAATLDADESVRYIAFRVGEERLVESRDDGTESCAAAFEPLLGRARLVLESKSPSDTRQVAVAAILLARAGDPAARTHVLRIVDGSVTCEKEDEQEAVELAGELGLREALPALERRAYGVKRLVRDTCDFHAKIALARLGHDRAQDEIRRDLASNRRDRRAAAVVAAGRARMTDLTSSIAALSDREVDPALRDEALSLLTATPNARARAGP